MIVTCPTCNSRYSVKDEVIGESKLVRCAVCCTMWHYVAANYTAATKQSRVWYMIYWTVFWFAVFLSIFSLFFARDAMVRIWPPVTNFYRAVGLGVDGTKKNLQIQNVSNFFVQKSGNLYMGLKGEIVNVSDRVQVLPCVTISLQNEESVTDSKEERRAPYKKTWTHDMNYKKLLPNQQVVFETELQSVPYHNLICDLKLDVM
ncbi:MAG: zinc-ribbon domain-containing protein [Holosporaceae bacterium]|nr:zinc-ribbon domain-containing protein [Holosporaceae bacterium]